MIHYFKKPIFQILFFGILLGIVLILIYGARQPEMKDRKIVIDDADLAHMIAGWQRTWKRMPSKKELQGIMNAYVRDEVVYREALNQDMDENNATVRRALISQMDMLAEGQGAEKPITAEDIQAYYDLRKERFMAPPYIKFHQVYFKNNDSDSLLLYQKAEQWNLENLPPEKAASEGNSSMLPPRMNLQTAEAIDREFGTGFSDKLLQLPEDQWSGPVNSGFGSHLIYLDTIVPARLLSLEQVEDEIIDMLKYEEKQAAKEQFYTELLQQYEIIYQGVSKDLLNE
ncbi:peptidyl-prolyl cis-trans isomerase [Robertkochia aurantiaca]|uniref:peptidylprolyl isomerase n=1 Tax=Robertkochia aurantiaca TaxID=2873700 RepID=UPI001CCA2918|nr:peptidylprolyl isomerase [Robertkochia sp. 3YJGBD-33]